MAVGEELFVKLEEALPVDEKWVTFFGNNLAPGTVVRQALVTGGSVNLNFFNNGSTAESVKKLAEELQQYWGKWLVISASNVTVNLRVKPGAIDVI